MGKKVVSLLMLLVLLMSCIPGAQAAGKLEIVTQPTPQITLEGGSCTFTASAKGNTGITWRLMTPDGSEDFPFTNAAEHFPGLKVSGKNSDKLTLSNIPGEMDGWLVYCRYSTRSSFVDTEKVFLFVTDHNGKRINGDAEEAAIPDADPEDAIDDTAASVVLPATNEKVIRTYGAVMHFVDRSGNTKGDSFTELNFGEEYYNTMTRKTITDGSVDVKVSADVTKGQTVEYWVINGTKYTFNREVRSFTLREVPYAMIIEAVTAGAEPQTLLTADAIQQNRTGAPLLVESKDARMYHVDAQSKSGGDTFYEFDFTHDYINKATGEDEMGGRITTRVVARIPEGMRVSFWRFNGARLNFNSDVTSFLVENLHESMLYRPYFYQTFTVKCQGCTFSGGGYSGATSGTVAAGTQITITPGGNSYLGWWSGSYGTGEVTDKPITWTVNDNCSFEWHAIIN